MINCNNRRFNRLIYPKTKVSRCPLILCPGESGHSGWSCGALLIVERIGSVAQWIARWSSEPKVPGSSPGRIASFLNRKSLALRLLLFLTFFRSRFPHTKIGAIRAARLPQAAPGVLVQTKQTTVNATKTIPIQLHCFNALNRRAASFG